MIKRRDFIKIAGAAALAPLSLLPLAQDSAAQKANPAPTPTPTPAPTPDYSQYSGTYIITEPCIGHKDTTCADACPVEAIYGKTEDWDQLFINPDECITCGICREMCPYEAIYPFPEVPEKWKSYIGKNIEHFKKK
ncbi:MAG: 4Fe-4S binding protein [Acidobacteria bacterium]|nr:4Fe-4S binding protein [Acidobacteriota bacterium]